MSTSSASAVSWKKGSTWLFLIFVVVMSYFTYFHKYWNPPYVFWDENYHIASAQKYLHGVYFMEQHPPLGKLLIALGEKIVSPNEKTDQFLGTDYGTQFGDGFSFAGYRFFSALLSWWTAPLLFLLFLKLLRSPVSASLLSSLYIFDNAMITHSRGAMLEGPLLFFSVLMLLCFAALSENRPGNKRFILLSLAFGLTFALILTTKVLGLIFILLVPAVLWKLWDIKKGLKLIALFSAAFLPVYLGIWYIHFSLGARVNPVLPDQGYYQASDGYKQALIKGETSSLAWYPTMLRDSLHFVSHYNNGAPRLDFCKNDENGSPFYLWPFGGRSINYRWETPNQQVFRYLYIVANPMSWWLGTAAVVLSAALLLFSVIFPFREKLRHRFSLSIFLGLYVSYMLAISTIDRVLYLYHYFIPLTFSFILLGLVIDELFLSRSWSISTRRMALLERLVPIVCWVVLFASLIPSFAILLHRNPDSLALEHYLIPTILFGGLISLSLLYLQSEPHVSVAHRLQAVALIGYGTLVLLTFQVIGPLSYYEPIGDTAVKARSAIAPIWGLRCVHCDPVNGVAVSCRSPGQ